MIPVADGTRGENMAAPQTFSGTGVVYRADGRTLQGKRRYSFTLLPYELPPLRVLRCR